MEDDAINVQKQEDISKSMVNTNQENEEINLPKGQEINLESNNDLENQHEDETEKKEGSTGVATSEPNNTEELQPSTEELPTEEKNTTTLPKVEDTAVQEDKPYEIKVDLAKEGPKDSAISSLLKEAKINQILDMKNKLGSLISNIRDTRTLCEKYDNENQYLQDYIGSLMKSGELK